MNKYHKHGYVYNFINTIIEESKYCTDIIKMHLNKRLVMTIEDDEKIDSTKC